jgi:hypothetical protein
MRKNLVVLLLTSLALSSFIEKEKPAAISKLRQAAGPKDISADSIKKFTIDNYPVPDEMFGRDVKQDGREIWSAEIYSSDKIWFSNASLKQALVFEIYTDNFRNIMFNFYTNDTPKALIQFMELHREGGELASNTQKIKNFKGLLKAATGIDKKYFTSIKGLELGDEKNKILKIYGKPDSTNTVEDGIEKCEWDFAGDYVYEGNSDLKGKRLAKNSYGNETILFFKNNKLNAVIIHNEIP